MPIRKLILKTGETFQVGRPNPRKLGRTVKSITHVGDMYIISSYGGRPVQIAEGHVQSSSGR